MTQPKAKALWELLKKGEEDRNETVANAEALLTATAINALHCPQPHVTQPSFVNARLITNMLEQMDAEQLEGVKCYCKILIGEA